MTTTAKPVSLITVRGLIAKKYRTRGGSLRVHKDAMTPAKRDECNRRRSEIETRKKEIHAETEAMKGHWDRLLAAAEFVCDVNGDHPSIEQLREAVVASKRVKELAEERASLCEEQRKIGSRMYLKKYEVARLDRTMPGFPITVIEHSADTLEELYAKLKAMPAY